MLPLRFRTAQLAGRTIGQLSQALGLGRGSVLPGRVGLFLEPHTIPISRMMIRFGTILITGTNGKSTSTYYLTSLLRSLGYSVLTNPTGANMMSGIASACLSLKTPVDYAVFEVDEASLPKVAELLLPNFVVALNFSRDQMDRYTEIETITNKLLGVLERTKSTLIYNASNPYTAMLGDHYERSLGYNVVRPEPATQLDSPICQRCHAGFLMIVEHTVQCSYCSHQSSHNLQSFYREGLLRVLGKAIGCPTPELAETLTATALVCQQLGISEELIIQGLERTAPLPAHQQTFQFANATTNIELVLAKNPDSFNRQLKNCDLGQYTQLVVAINRHYADGVDTSWLWDVEFERLADFTGQIIAVGQAAADTELRLRVAGIHATSVTLDSEFVKLTRVPNRNILVLANYTTYQELYALLSQQHISYTNVATPPVTELEYI